MNRLKNILTSLLGRSAVLYLSASLILYFSIDWVRINAKILDDLRDSAQYVNRIAEFGAPFDERMVLDTIAYSKRLIHVSPNKEPSYGVLGYSYYLLGDYKNAISAYKKATVLMSNYFGYYFNLGYLYYKTGQWSKAINVLKRAVEVRPDISIVYQGRTGEFLFTDKDMINKWVVKSSKKIIKGYVDSYRLIILSYEQQNDYKKVYNTARKLIKHDTNDELFYHFYAGKAAFHLRKYEEALIYLNKCIELDKNYGPAFHFISEIYKDIGKETLAKFYQLSAEQLGQDMAFDKNIKENIKLIYYIPLYEAAPQEM